MGYAEGDQPRVQDRPFVLVDIFEGRLIINRQSKEVIQQLQINPKAEILCLVTESGVRVAGKPYPEMTEVRQKHKCFINIRSSGNVFAEER